MKKFASKLITFLTMAIMVCMMMSISAFAQTKEVTFDNPVTGGKSTVTLNENTKVAAIWAKDLKIQKEGTDFSSMLENEVLAWGTKNEPVIYLVVGDVELDFKLKTQINGKYIVGAEGTNATIIRGSNATSDLIEIGEDETLDFYNITLDGNGSEDGSGCTGIQTGGLLAIDGSSKLVNCTIQNDHIDDYVPSHAGEDHGTGTVRISANNSSNIKATVIMENCKVINNYSYGNGTGIYIGTAGTLTMQGKNEVTGNKSLNKKGWRGAGIYMKGNAVLKISGNLTVKENYSSTETAQFPSDIYVGGNTIRVSGDLTSAAGSIGIDNVSRYDMTGFATGTGTTGTEVIEDSPFFHDSHSECHVHQTGSGLIFCTDTHVQQSTITLAYDANGGTGTQTPDSRTVAQGAEATFTIAANAFTAPEGKVFAKWNTKADGTGTDYNPGSSLSTSSNMTLYAIWEDKTPEQTKIVLTYNANGGSGEMAAQEETVALGETAEFTVGENGFTAPEGKEFQEWNTKADGTGTTYAPTATLTTGESLTLYAIWKTKMSKTSFPGLEKYIVTDDEKEVKSTSVDAENKVNFKLISNVPQDLLNYLKPADPDQPSLLSFNSNQHGDEYYLKFHDVMDKGLKYEADSIKVLVNGRDVTDVTPEIGTDADGKTTIDVKLELVSLYHDNYFTKDDFGSAPIVLTYAASAADDLKAGKYYNKAWVEYEGDKTKEDSVVVNTYGINIFKYDQADKKKGLSGAKFTLYRVEEDSTETDTKIEIKSGITSGEDGYARYDGLKAGTYKLYETEAPENYVKSEVPLTITIPDDADSSNIASAQFANAEIPHTGGNGTGVYTIAGIGIILAAGLFLLITRKKKGQEN